MNIGPLLRSLMGDVRSGEPKSLELKTGQVVRGTVLSVSDDGQVAVIQVQGVKLHAALETPMRPGETTLLQVQPESKDGLAVLKPISSDPGTVLSPASLAKALESLGLENTPANREFLQMMQKSGIPLTRENLSLLQQVSGLKPAGVPLSEWIQAAGIAFGRGLPITGETVAGLHQAVFGPPLHVLLSSLEEQIAGFLRQAGPDMTGNGGHTGSGSAAGSSAQTGQTASPLLAGGTASPAPGSNAGTAAWGAAQAGTLPSGGGAQPNQAAGLVQLARQGAFAVASGGPQSPQPGLQGQQAASAPGGALVAKLQAVLAELQSSVLPEGTDLPGRAMAGPAGGAAADGKGPAAAAPQGEGPAGPSPAARTRPTLAAEPWVGRVLKLLGAEHEQQALRATAPAAGASARAAAGGAEAPGGQVPGSGPAAAPEAAPAPLRHAAAAGGAAPGEAELPPGKAQPLGAEATAAAVRSGSNVTAASTAAHETLKGLLLQVMASDELPAPLQEAARQLVQQLTGQQLLLNTDRTAPFAQVTMFLPLIGPDGRQTAAVHIESRRGRKGELDPANCRLWFDLQMKTLGQIMVDVQVADKKVLLKIYSEKETTGAFLESRQEEVSTALEKAGYRLLSLKAEPLIKPEGEESNEADFSQPMSYAPSVYKGVDYRV
ncbi:flagellar hook-length control protein FliK [Paenibacillus sp. FSL K6-2441]|uniref:flagellar hook-length control protein FliK n=1 Tax=Paenibacillus sp. FSL K6-2441 TaxID=2954679 RepID=UPI0030DA711B